MLRISAARAALNTPLPGSKSVYVDVDYDGTMLVKLQIARAIFDEFGAARFGSGFCLRAFIQQDSCFTLLCGRFAVGA